MRKSGRHFLQIPGPSAVPDRILRAMGNRLLITVVQILQKLDCNQLAGSSLFSTLLKMCSFTRRQGLALGKQPWSILCHRGTAF